MAYISFTTVRRGLLALGAVLLMCGTARGEGYQINSFSARQGGMGHVGVAMKLGSESMLFNPGALAFSRSHVEVSGSVTGVLATITAHQGDRQWQTDNKMSTPLNVCASFRIYDNLYAGVALFTPYGSAINWGDNWPGAVLSQRVKLKTFSLQPTFSWRPMPQLAIGAGLMISWGNVNLQKGLVSASSMDALMQAVGAPEGAMFQGVTPASVTLTGTSRPVLGVNLGAYWQINQQWAVGVNFRSKQTLKLKKGLADVTYANQLAEQQLSKVLGLIDQANFAASMPLPNVFTVGVSYRPIPKLILAADVQFNGWKCYEYLNIDFDLPEAMASQFNQHIRKDYKDAFTYHLGAQYAVTPRCDLRCGLLIDTSPCSKDNYNPETPGMTKIEPSVGLSFRPLKGLSIDVSFLYIKGLGQKNATGIYDDFIAKQAPQLGLPNPGRFTADYNVHAIAPSIGLSFAF